MSGISNTEFFFRAERLDAGYDGVAIVSGVNVALEKGGVLSIIGPNGSGKTTIIKSIVKQIKLVGGSAFIGGKSIADIDFREMSRQAAVMLTERPRPELMTCEEIVAAGRYPYTGPLGLLSKKDIAKVREALKIVGIYDMKDQYFLRISDGQRQRVMLARAICQEPQIIALDEPTSYLDIRVAVEILDVLKAMARERGMTIIMSLHELIYAKRVSDLVLCVKNGAALYLDTPDKIFTERIISDLYDLPKGTYDQLFGGL